jgi:4-hydroxy 2-oxovalerate aldolase
MSQNFKLAKLKVLDCTLRDGGYYNNWDFNELLVDKYLSAMSDAKVDIVEIGFRFLPQKKFLGKFAYSEDNFLNSISLPKNLSYAVMINASDLINYEAGLDCAIDLLFSDKKNSPIDIVRIATHAVDIALCEPIAIALKTLGYRVFMNIMQISSMDTKAIESASKDINRWGCVDVLYFADSFGNMESELILSVITSLSSQWNGDLGIHTHDNKNQALGNSLTAIESGVSFVDATLLGMGRGAGNAKTESLLVEINQRKYGKYFPDAIFPLALNEFTLLQKKFKWGPNIYYFLSAVHGIHPTYIQEMSGDKRYDTNQILSAINFLKTADASFYSFESMIKAVSTNSGSEKGAWSAKNWAREKDILIIGSGPSTEFYKDEIIGFIKRKNPTVLCLNINESIPQDLVTAYVACHESRILIESEQYLKLTKPIILPFGNLPDELKKILTGVNYLDYGLRIKEGLFDVMEKGCILDGPLAINYAISVATASGAKQVLLTGIDGYEKLDSRQLEMIDSLDRYSKLKKSIPIFAITPTTYPIEEKSIYMSERFDEMAGLLEKGKYFKLVCGAGNEDAEEVKRLTILYTLAGAKGMDVSANVEVVKACGEGIDIAFNLAKEFNIKLKIRPFIMVSVGMPGDHHVRKSFINLDTCLQCDLCIPVCPTDAIPESLVVIKDKCIGCGNCSAVCPRPDIIHYEHNERSLRHLLPECLKAGAEQIELHAAVADDDSIMEEWKMVNELCPDGHISMCLDRLHLSNFAFEARIEKAKKIAKERLIIQSDGYPMSGGEDDYNTTLQAVSTADILNKKFNMTLRKRNNTLIYKKNNEVNQLISGGTNSLTAKLAKLSGVRFQGASLGTFARQIVKEIVENDNFYGDKELIKKGYIIAKDLVNENIGQINE